MRLINYISLFILTLSFIACDSNDEFPYPVPEKKLVAECIAEQGKLFNVKVFLPKALNDTTSYEYRSQCNVEIQAPGISTDILHYNPATKSYMSTPGYIAQPGKFYKLKIEDPEYGLITADDIFPQSSTVTVDPISSLKKIDSSTKGELFKYDINLNLPLADGLTPLYYTILLTERLKLNSGGIKERRGEILNINQSAPYADLLYHKGGILIEGESNSKVSLDLSLNCSSLEVPGQDSLIEIVLDIRTTSVNYYLFYKSVNEQVKQASNPLGSPSPLYSNFKNGLGIFGGYSSKKQTINLPAH